MRPPMPHQVYVAYSSQDRATATAACLALENDRVRCWIAPRDLTPGVSEQEAASEALKTALLLLIVVSPSSSHSPMVLHQVTAAVRQSVPLLLFRVGGAALSRPMQVLLPEPSWVETADPPTPAELRSLVDAVCLRLARESQNRLKPWEEESIRDTLEDARVLLRYRLVDKALAKLMDLRDRFPFHPGVSEELVQVYQDLGRLRDVAAQLNELARIYEGIGQSQRASELRDHARQLTPLAPHTVVELGAEELEPYEEDNSSLTDPGATTALSPPEPDEEA